MVIHTLVYDVQILAIILEVGNDRINFLDTIIINFNNKIIFDWY